MGSSPGSGPIIHYWPQAHGEGGPFAGLGGVDCPRHRPFVGPPSTGSGQASTGSGRTDTPALTGSDGDPVVLGAHAEIDVLGGVAERVERVAAVLRNPDVFLEHVPEEDDALVRAAEDLL